MTRRLAPLVLLACAALPIALACGGDSKSGTSTPAASASAASQTSGASGVSPKLDAPANKYTVLREDLSGGPWIVDIPNTFVHDAKSYGQKPVFESAQDGESKLRQWGYLGGYESALVPDGRLQALLAGGYLVTTEVHLFQDEEGAKKAFAYLDGRIRSIGGQGVQTIKIDGVGNQSDAYTVISGKVGTSNVDRAAYNIVFRRGNLVASVLTVGAQPFMKVDMARSIAAIIDSKALGTTATITPTPTSNFTPPAGSVPQASPTAAGR